MSKTFSVKKTSMRSNRDGYILLTTILIIAMVSILTVGLARQSMNMAIAARSSQHQLQEKWGASSCQRVALASQGALLNPRVWDADQQTWTVAPIANSASSFELGEMRFNIRLSDESAKLNMNQVYAQQGKQKTSQLVQKFSRTESLVVNLKELISANQRGSAEDRFESWGQVFEVRNGQLELSDLRDATDSLTCWGSQLNYRTASEPVLVETCKPIIGASMTQRLLGILKSDDASEWESQLLAAGAKSDRVQDLSEVLTGRSGTQSVWVESVLNLRRRNWLTVRERIAQSLHRIHSFSW